MYTNTRQLGGLGIPPAAIPVATAVVKNLNLFSLFGGKLIHGLKKDEFEGRHENPTWFRALWYHGYWDREGAGEIPHGLSIQDYYVKRFRIVPFIPHQSVYERLRRGGTSDSSLRLSSIPVDMRWPADVENIPLDAIQRVLPRGYRWDPVNRRAVPTAAAVPSRPGVPGIPVGAAVTSVSNILPLLAAGGVLLYLVMRR